MPVTALKPYDFSPRDTVDKFPAPLLYLLWDDHLMFAAPFCVPVPGATPFRALLESVLPAIYGAHPDFAKIAWSETEWTKSGTPWTPDPDRSLAENGVTHKDLLRFRTPGLTGIRNSYS